MTTTKGENIVILLEPLQELVKLILWSAYLGGEKHPISALFVAEPESGKTDLLFQVASNKGVAICSDITAYGILKQFGNQLVDKSVRHLLIPDLVTPLAKLKNTSSSLISFFNQLTEEGVVSVHTYAINFEEKKPVRCGIIAGITPSVLRDRRRPWMGMGFMSRMLPISWSYAEGTVISVMGYIDGKKYQSEPCHIYNFPNEDVEVGLPEELARLMHDYTIPLGKAQGAYGFRYQRHFQQLLMASALSEGRQLVTLADVDRVRGLARFINLSFTQI